MTTTIRHPALGLLKGIQITKDLTQFRSIRYATIPHRFARSKLVAYPTSACSGPPQDLTHIGPCSIQPENSAFTDAKSNQLPQDHIKEQTQSEDCLRLTITRPTTIAPGTLLPVLVFLHGGAFFVGSGERPYYSPTTFCEAAIAQSQPLIFISINYRLGALGFLHSPNAGELVPPNNGLHDQVRAFEWIAAHVAGFGGDPANITALGQSAGAESLSLHTINGGNVPLYRRAVMFSGTPVTMPAMTGAEHGENFMKLAGKLGWETEGRDGQAVAEDMMRVDVKKVRELAWVGAPCTGSEILPYERVSQRLSKEGPDGQVGWLESQVVSTTTYDGSISFIMTKQDSSRKEHAKSFAKIAREVLKQPEQLLDLYELKETDADDSALHKICLFESDIGFFLAAHAVACGYTTRETFFQVFDIGNPFEGYLEKGEFATHTWDIVALLGAYEDRVSEVYRRVIGQWRSRIIAYVNTGVAPWKPWREKGMGLRVAKDGVEEVDAGGLLGARRARLLELAEEERRSDGSDCLWEKVCRRWLMQGE